MLKPDLRQASYAWQWQTASLHVPSAHVARPWEHTSKPSFILVAPPWRRQIGARKQDITIICLLKRKSKPAHQLPSLHRLPDRLVTSYTLLTGDQFPEHHDDRSSDGRRRIHRDAYCETPPFYLRADCVCLDALVTCMHLELCML
jgi:hypothetical protein